jgi:hypothetical protein
MAGGTVLMRATFAVMSCLMVVALRYEVLPEEGFS